MFPSKHHPDLCPELKTAENRKSLLRCFLSRSMGAFYVHSDKFLNSHIPDFSIVSEAGPGGSPTRVPIVNCKNFLFKLDVQVFIPGCRTLCVAACNHRSFRARINCEWARIICHWPRLNDNGPGLTATIRR